MVCSVFLDDIFYHFGEIFHFEHVLFLSDGLYGVVGGKGDPVLGDDLSGITFGGDPMDGHACLRLTSGFHRLVHMVSPHALATVFRQQGRVDIDDLVWEGVDEEIGNQGQPTCQDDEADVVFAKQGQYDVRVMQIGLGGDSRWHTEAPNPFKDKGVGLVADD